jgi:nucleoside-diphosphate-sugar epimerase
MRILVTGAGGYVGIPLCNELIQRDHHVVGLDRYYFGEDKLGPLAMHPHFRKLVDDIRYFDTAVLRDVDAVIDLAGLSNDHSAALDPELTRQINMDGCARIARAARESGVRRYVFSSSASIYGAGEKISLSETDVCHPLTDYARSKLATEQVLAELAGPKFETVILRNATIFGLAPRMRFDLAINIMTMRAWHERVIFIMGGGKQWRPFIHVRDVVRAMIHALEEPAELVAGEIFNVGDDDMNFQIEQLSRFIVDVIPNVTVHRVPDDTDARTYNLSFAKIKQRLGFHANVRVHEGIVEIKQALERGVIQPSDPTTVTLTWYQSLIEWERRIEQLRVNGRVL